MTSQLVTWKTVRKTQIFFPVDWYILLNILHAYVITIDAELHFIKS